MHPASGLFLTIRGGSHSVKAELWMNTRKNTKAQQWKFDERALVKAATLLQGIARTFQAKQFMKRMRLAMAAERARKAEEEGQIASEAVVRITS